MLAVVAVPSIAWAQAACSPSYSGTQLCNAIPVFGGKAVTDIPGFIQAALSWLATVIGTLALVMIIFAGAQMIFSRGDSKATTQAKTTLTYSIFGVIIVMFAYVIVSAIQYFFRFNNEFQPGKEMSGFFVNPIADTNLLTFVAGTTTRFLGIIGAAAIFYIILSGFRYITSGGNEDQAKKARAGLTWAIFGLISIILSYMIITAVINTVIRTTR